MKTQAYIYLESDQVYGDYIDHFYNEHNIKCMRIMLRVKLEIYFTPVHLYSKTSLHGY